MLLQTLASSFPKIITEFIDLEILFNNLSSEQFTEAQRTLALQALRQSYSEIFNSFFEVDRLLEGKINNITEEQITLILLGLLPHMSNILMCINATLHKYFWDPFNFSTESGSSRPILTDLHKTIILIGMRDKRLDYSAGAGNPKNIWALLENEIITQEQHDFLLGRGELYLPEELAALIQDEAGSADDAVLFATPSRSLGM